MVWFYPCFSDLSVKTPATCSQGSYFTTNTGECKEMMTLTALSSSCFFLWCYILPQEHTVVLPTRIPRSWPTLPPPLGGTCQPSISASYPSPLLPPLSLTSTICTKSPLAKGFPYPVTWVSIPVTRCLQSGSSAISDSRWVFITCPIAGTKCLSNTI